VLCRHPGTLPGNFGTLSANPGTLHRNPGMLLANLGTPRLVTGRPTSVAVELSTATPVVHRQDRQLGIVGARR